MPSFYYFWGKYIEKVNKKSLDCTSTFELKVYFVILNSNFLSNGNPTNCQI